MASQNPSTPAPSPSSDPKYPFANATGLLQVCESSIDVEEEDQFWEDFPEEDEFFEPHLPRRKGRARSIASNSLKLADNTAEPSDCFARNVSIPGWSSVGDKLGGAYVVFDCAILTKDGTTIHTPKRYTAFLRLQEEICVTVPELKAVLPPFPPKNTFAKYRPSFLEKRRRRLQSWLASVLLHPVLGGLPCVRKWVIE